MSARKPDPSDLSDEQWPLTEPVITEWKDRHRSVGGHQAAYDMREIVNAILHQGRTGCVRGDLVRPVPHSAGSSQGRASMRSMCSSPHCPSGASASLSELPKSVSEYSTLGGTWWKTFLRTRPLASISRS